MVGDDPSQLFVDGLGGVREVGGGGEEEREENVRNVLGLPKF